MIARGLVAWLSLAACGAGCGGAEPITQAPPQSSATTAASVTPVAPPPAEACLPHAAAKGALLDARLKDDHALVCYAVGEGEDDGMCADVDVKTGKVVKTQKLVRSDASAAATNGFVVTTTPTTVKVCKAATPNDCATVKVQHKPQPAGHSDAPNKTDAIATVSDDGARVFVFAPELKPGANPSLTTGWTTYGDTYDTKTGKRLFHHRLTTEASRVFSDPSDVWSASFVGKNIVLRDVVCCGPGGNTMLFDPEKGTLKHLHEYAGSFTQASGTIYAVLDRKKLWFVDVATMQDVGGASMTAPGEHLSDPEQASALFVSGPSKHVLAYANPPGLWLLDATTRARERAVELPICP